MRNKDPDHKAAVFNDVSSELRFSVSRRDKIGAGNSVLINILCLLFLSFLIIISRGNVSVIQQKKSRFMASFIAYWNNDVHQRHNKCQTRK